MREQSFDSVARPYRWLELLAFGNALEHCRQHFLPRLADCTNALVLGDGDGRFLAELLRRNPKVEATAVDTSGAMLRLLASRCNFASDRLHVHQGDACDFANLLSTRMATGPASAPYDLVVAHFFLDCLSQQKVDGLVADVATSVRPGSIFLVSDFQVPTGAMRLPARMLIRSLYLCFRIATGLRITSLPVHRTALTRAGFTLVATRCSLAGVLITELWQLPLNNLCSVLSPDEAH